MRDEIKIALFALALVASLILAVVGLANWLERGSCAARRRDSGLESRYSFWTECQVRLKGRWIPASNYREM